MIADPPLGAPYTELFVSRADFEGQMRWLERRGYRPVTLRAVWDHWHRGVALSKKPIVITFDDGYREVADDALPTMRERQWPGVLNLTVKEPSRLRRAERQAGTALDCSGLGDRRAFLHSSRSHWTGRRESPA